MLGRHARIVEGDVDDDSNVQRFIEHHARGYYYFCVEVEMTSFFLDVLCGTRSFLNRFFTGSFVLDSTIKPDVTPACHVILSIFFPRK